LLGNDKDLFACGGKFGKRQRYQTFRMSLPYIAEGGVVEYKGYHKHCQGWSS